MVCKQQQRLKYHKSKSNAVHRENAEPKSGVHEADREIEREREARRDTMNVL